MRILVATHNYPRFPGDPAGAFVRRIAIGVAARGHHVTVVAPHAPGLSTEVDTAVALRRFRYAPVALENVAYRGDMHHLSAAPKRLLGLPLFLLGFRRALRRAIEISRPDVIHAHWWLPSGWLASSFGYPLVVTVHGSDVRLLDHSALARNLARRVLRKATAITTVSDFLARDLGARLPNFAQRIRTVPMPVDIEKFASGKRVPKKSPPLVLYAGNLLESKGVDILLRAYAKLRASDVRCQLKILGEGPATSSLRRLASELGIAREVVWSNFVPQDAMPAEYGASTITVLPTRGNAEGLGLTLVEALLAGCAVVGTPAGGIPEIVRDQVTGLVARDGDSDDLASKIGRLIADPSLRDRLQSAGEELARKRFAADQAVSSIISIYDDAARNRIAS